MTIKADRWIKANSGGEPLFDYYYNDRKVHSLVTASTFRFPDLIEKINALKVGESYQPEDEFVTDVTGKELSKNYTKIVKVTNGDLIAPFIAESKKTVLLDGKELTLPSYGLSSYGYDIRLGRNFMFATASSIMIDPANYYPEDFFVELNDYNFVDLPPQTFALGVSMECVNMPSNMMATCMAKSSVARYGLDASVTPIEPGFKGFITLELFNKTQNHIRLYAGQGIMQLIFHESDERCEVSYADRGGKYQNQPAFPVPAR